MAIKRKKVVEIPKEERKVKRKKLTNEDSRPERQLTTGDLFKAVGPQAIGLLVGGLLGGRDGAIQGGQQGAQAGQAINTVLNAAQKRDDQRHDAEFIQDLQLDAARSREEQADVLNGIKQQNADNKARELGQLKASNEFFSKSTRQPLIDTKRGFFLDLKGNRVNPEDVGSFKDLSDEDRDAQREISTAQLLERRTSNQLALAKFQQSKSDKDELSDKQSEEIADLQSGIKSVGRIKSLSNKVDTGPISGRIQDAKSTIGLASKDFVKLRSETGSTLAKFVKSISGGAVSEEEAQRLAKLIPQTNDDEKTFNAKLEQFEIILKDSLDAKATAIQQFQGKSIPGLDAGQNINSIIDNKLSFD